MGPNNRAEWFDPGARGEVTGAPLPGAAEAEAYNNRGVRRSAAGDYAGAVADFTAALRLNPRLAEAYHNRAGAHYNRGDFLAAMGDFDAALRVNPGFAPAYSNRGNARFGRGNVAAALADFDAALRLAPGYAQAHANRSPARYSLGDDAGALADLDEALRLDPQSADAAFKRAWVRLDRGDFPGALADFDAVLRHQPGHRKAITDRAFAARLASAPAPPPPGAAAGGEVPGPVVNGADWRETFYQVEDGFTSRFTAAPMTLGEFFLRDFSGRRGLRKQDLPGFALYRNPDLGIDPDALYHPMDFTRNAVHVLVAELDNWKAYSLEQVLKQKGPGPHDVRQFLRDNLGEEYDRLRAYTVDVWQRLNADPRTLFSYLSPSGLGIRFGVFFRRPIRSPAEYRVRFMETSWQFLNRYDTAIRMRTDWTMFRGLNYWFAPSGNDVFVNRACQAL